MMRTLLGHSCRAGAAIVQKRSMHQSVARSATAAIMASSAQQQQQQQQQSWWRCLHVAAGAAAAFVGNTIIEGKAATAEGTETVTGACSSELCPIDAFSTMAEEHGVRIGSGVVLKEGANGRGLFTTTGCENGSLLLRVPLDRCLFIEAGDPEMQQESGGLGWSFWMMLKLLRISDKNGVHADPFWQKYREVFMPSPAEVLETIPTGMAREWLESYSSEVPVVNEVVKLRERLDETCKQLVGKAPSAAMVWGLAAVLSRCFALDASTSTVALVPFIDMLNHGGVAGANAKLRVDQTKTTVFVYATRDLLPDEEVLISYADEAPNKALLMKYGFVLAGGSPDDNIDFPNADSANTLSGDRLQAFLKAEHGGEEWEATLGTRLHIVLNSLPILPENVTVAEEIAYIAELHTWLASNIAKNKVLQKRKDAGPLSYYLVDELASLETAESFLSNYAAYLQEIKR